MAPKRKYILEGKRFGKLLVVKEVPFKTNKDRQYLCQCDCGNLKEIRLRYLLKNTISCGCALPIEMHGEGKTKLYGVWKSIVERCESKTHHAFARYGGRGIAICHEWRNRFSSFKKWALSNGYSEGLQIDRRDNDGNYEPINCRFVTAVENNNNREVTLRVLYKGEIRPLALILRDKGLMDKYPLIWQRINKHKWPVEDAIDRPIRLKNQLRR